MDAPTVGKARAELRAQRIRIKKIKEKKPKSKSGLNMDITWGPFGDIPAKEIMLFSKKLSTMIRAGLPILDSLIMVADQTKNPNMKRTIGEMIDDLNDGKSLSQVFKKAKKTFR